MSYTLPQFTKKEPVVVIIMIIKTWLCFTIFIMTKSNWCNHAATCIPQHSIFHGPNISNPRASRQQLALLLFTLAQPFYMQTCNPNCLSLEWTLPSFFSCVPTLLLLLMQPNLCCSPEKHGGGFLQLLDKEQGNINSKQII